MATLDLGSARRRRRVDHDLPLVPFIDFLLCIVAFLLVTAVWTRMSRMDATARIPGDPSAAAAELRAQLHVQQRGDDRFVLSWKQGTTVVARDAVTAPAVRLSDGGLSRPALARALRASFKAHGIHRAASDSAPDVAVVHTPNGAPFAETIAVLDAVYSVERPSDSAGMMRAFVASFATD